MLRLAVAMGLALPGLALAAPSAAQAFGDLPADASVPEESLTAEQILERAQDRLRPPSVRRPCKLPENPNEIVVCGRDPNENRVESPTERAIAEGRSVPDGLPRAPNVDGPGIFQGKGIALGRDPEPVLIVDLSKVPEPLSPEDAQRVYRVEDGPPRAAVPITPTP